MDLCISMFTCSSLARSCISSHGRSVVLHVNGLDNKNYTLPITNLLEEINKDQSYWKVKTDNVTVFLAKKNIGSKWTHMTCSEKKALDSKLPKMDGAGEDPSGGLMDMMKHMYETGDDEMKRTIAKAWTETAVLPNASPYTTSSFTPPKLEEHLLSPPHTVQDLLLDRLLGAEQGTLLASQLVSLDRSHAIFHAWELSQSENNLRSRDQRVSRGSLLN
uniref:SGS domain-containing protein n=1 Tax=Timema bartmani TaxID=61472 RepID=A0A7R9F8F1_9NEOP|nr:unnamed protein product [Timema bartmani]